MKKDGYTAFWVKLIAAAAVVLKDFAPYVPTEDFLRSGSHIICPSVNHAFPCKDLSVVLKVLSKK